MTLTTSPLRPHPATPGNYVDHARAQVEGAGDLTSDLTQALRSAGVIGASDDGDSGIVAKLRNSWSESWGLDLRNIPMPILAVPGIGRMLSRMVEGLCQDPHAQTYPVAFPGLTHMGQTDIVNLLNGFPHARKFDLPVTSSMLDAHNQFDTTGLYERQGGHVLVFALRLATTVPGKVLLAPGRFSAVAVSGDCKGWKVEQARLSIPGPQQELGEMKLQLEELRYVPELGDIPDTPATRDSFRLFTPGGIVEVGPQGLRFGRQVAPLTLEAVELLRALSMAERSDLALTAYKDRGVPQSEVAAALQEVRLRSSEVGCLLLDIRRARGSDRSEVVRLFRTAGGGGDGACPDVLFAAAPLVSALTRDLGGRKSLAWVESNIPPVASQLLRRWTPGAGLDLRGVPAFVLGSPGIEKILNAMVEGLCPGIRGYIVHRDVPQIPGVTRLKTPGGMVEVGPGVLKFRGQTLELTQAQDELLGCFMEHGKHGMVAFLVRGHSVAEFFDGFTALRAKTNEMGCSLFEFESNPVAPGWGIRCLYKPVTAVDIAWAQAQEGRTRDCLVLRTHGITGGLVAASPGSLRRLSSLDMDCMVGPEVVLTPGASKLLECLMDFDDHEMAFQLFRSRTSNMQAGLARGALLNACDELGLQLIPERSGDGMRSRWFEIEGVFCVVAPPAAAVPGG